MYSGSKSIVVPPRMPSKLRTWLPLKLMLPAKPAVALTLRVPTSMMLTLPRGSTRFDGSPSLATLFASPKAEVSICCTRLPLPSPSASAPFRPTTHSDYVAASKPTISEVWPATPVAACW